MGSEGRSLTIIASRYGALKKSAEHKTNMRKLLGADHVRKEKYLLLQKKWDYMD